AYALFRERYRMKPELAAQAEHWLGVIQLDRHSYPEAETLLVANADPLFAKTACLSNAERRILVGHILKLYQALDKPQAAALWQRKLEEIGETQEKRKTGQTAAP